VPLQTAPRRYAQSRHDTAPERREAPQKLMPRGILLAGEAGVGKSMASTVIAKHWDVPLYHLDISTSLNRWLGESESRISQNLQIIEAGAPAVWLLDLK
jgi:SpoVK/Ycf46/Vps4 family AAA+-type ATPase